MDNFLFFVLLPIILLKLWIMPKVDALNFNKPEGFKTIISEGRSPECIIGLKAEGLLNLKHQTRASFRVSKEFRQ